MNCQGVSPRQARERALELLELVDVSDAQRRLDQFPHELSGGMRQRVMIASAMAGEPKVIVADEPTTALDVTVQSQILALLKTLQRQTGMALVLITHGTAEQTRHLHACIANVIDAEESEGGSMRGLSVTRSDSGGELMLVICPLDGANSQTSRAAIFVSDTARRPAIPAHMLAALFDLTRAEAQVAHGLVSGRRRADIEQMALAAAAIGALSAVLGLHSVYAFDMLAGPSIVCFAAVAFLCTSVLRTVRPGPSRKRN